MPPRIAPRAPLVPLTLNQAIIDLRDGLSGVSSTSKKRKSDGVDEAENDDESDFDLYDEMDGMPLTKTPAQVRTKIRHLIDSGEFKIGKFCDKIKVSNRSYNDFMRQTRGGDNSNTYLHGHAYLCYRERKGKKITAKRAKKDVDATGKAIKADLDVSSIHLDGEESNRVQVYDSCDEIRRKIDQLLRKPGVTQAALVRAINAQSNPPKSFSSTTLNTFRSKRGANAGATAGIFYCAYVFFEKLRIKEGKEKSAHRLGMEREWKQDGGFDLKHGSHSGLWVFGDEEPVIDEWGKVWIGKRKL